MKSTVWLLALLFSTTLLADDYKPPKFDFKRNFERPQKAKIKHESWSNENQYKIDENFEPERDLASDEDEGAYRNPSSLLAPQDPKPWKFELKEFDVGH